MAKRPIKDPFPEWPEWSKSKFWSFIRSGLRAKWSRWPGKYDALAKAKRPYAGTNPRQKHEYICAKCKGWFPQQNVSVDHIVPAGVLSCFEDLPEFCERLFVSHDKLRVLCNPCHAEITALDRKASARKAFPREEASWRNMKSRCLNPKATGYDLYGGRGISVCQRWRESFWNFLEDMGTRPDGTTLDRIDSNGDYEPANCRWAAWETQANNKNDNVLLLWDGEQKTISQWARELDVLPNTIQYRLYRGWSVGEALGKEQRLIPSKRLLQGHVLDYVKEQLALGRSQASIGREIGIDSSAISRAVSETAQERAADKEKKDECKRIVSDSDSDKPSRSNRTKSPRKTAGRSTRGSSS